MDLIQQKILRCNECVLANIWYREGSSVKKMYAEEPVDQVSLALFLVLSTGGTFPRFLMQRQSTTSSRKTISTRRHAISLTKVARSPRKETTVKYLGLFFSANARRHIPTRFKFTSKCHPTSPGATERLRNGDQKIRAHRNGMRRDCRNVSTVLRPALSIAIPRFRDASKLYFSLSRFSSSLYASWESPVIIGFTIMHCTVRINWCMCSI